VRINISMGQGFENHFWADTGRVTQGDGKKRSVHGSILNLDCTPSFYGIENPKFLRFIDRTRFIRQSVVAFQHSKRGGLWINDGHASLILPSTDPLFYYQQGTARGLHFWFLFDMIESTIKQRYNRIMI